MMAGLLELEAMRGRVLEVEAEESEGWAASLFYFLCVFFLFRF
jgi:hypothetical protein